MPPPAKLRTLAEGLFEVPNVAKPAPGVHFPGRMIVARLADGGLWLCSPVPIDDTLAAELAALGPVRHIVGPNYFHHLYLAQAIARYPEATVWAPVALQRKRPDIAFHDEPLGDEAPAAWKADFDQAQICGTKPQEVVFLHRMTRTLIVTDLIFNLHEVTGLFTGLVLRMAGAYRKPAQSRLWRMMTKDRDAARACVQRILSWDFDRVVMAHGRIVEGPDAKRTLTEGVWWMLGEPKPAALPAP